MPGFLPGPRPNGNFCRHAVLLILVLASVLGAGAAAAVAAAAPCGACRLRQRRLRHVAGSPPLSALR